MNTKRALHVCTTVASLFAFAALSASAADVSDLSKAKVVRIKGSARYTLGNGAWQPLKVGKVLESGVVVQTAADSRVDLILGEPDASPPVPHYGTVVGRATPAASVGGGGGGGGGGSDFVEHNFVRIMENSVLSIDKLAATQTGADVVTETQLDLRAGKIFGTVKKMSSGSRYEVKIPNGIAGVRGTVFMISSDGVVSVMSGSVVVSRRAGTNADGTPMIETQVVNEGQQYDPTTGQVSDMPPGVATAMAQNLAGAGSSTPLSTTTTFSSDTTILTVSPTAGDGSEGGGGGGGE